MEKSNEDRRKSEVQEKLKKKEWTENEEKM